MSLIKKNEPLFHYTTLKIGGVADYFCEPGSIQEVYEALLFANDNDLPWEVIGNGSNILFDDNGFRGIIIKIGKKLSKMKIERGYMSVEAGAWMPCVAKAAYHKCYSDLVHTAGIPGNIGGMVMMNGGSQRKNIAESIISVKTMLPDGSIKIFPKEECDFSYRYSKFQDMKIVVLSVVLKLDIINSKKVIRNDILNTLRQRRLKFPLKSPNCGSVFKSIPNIYEKFGTPGEIIESLGLKGSHIGDAVISDQHANFIINKGNAHSEDIKKLIKLIQKSAFETYKIELSRELIFFNDIKQER